LPFKKSGKDLRKAHIQDFTFLRIFQLQISINSNLFLQANRKIKVTIHLIIRFFRLFADFLMLKLLHFAFYIRNAQRFYRSVFQAWDLSDYLYALF